MATPLTAEEEASCHVHIWRCKGRTASGNDARCHPHAEPGGYDVGFGMIPLNTQLPFASFEEAKEYALSFQHMLGRVIQADRQGRDHGPPQNIKDLKEVDIFGGREAHIAAEEWLKHVEGFDAKYRVIGDLRKCRYGWIARWDTREAWHEWGGESDWYCWEGVCPPYNREHNFLLVVPPTGKVYQLTWGLTLESMYTELLKAFPEVTPVYEDNPDYDLLMSAGIADFQASNAVVGNPVYLRQVYTDAMRRSFNPKYRKQVRETLRRLALAAGVDLSIP